MKNQLYILIFLLFAVFYRSQVKEDFRYFLDKATVTLYNDPDESMVFIQNLMNNDKNAENQLIYRNLIAQSYIFKGDYLNAVKSSLGRDYSHTEKKIPFYDLYMNYSFADQYQNLGLFDQSEKSIKRVLEMHRLPENAEAQIIVGKLFQLQAINFIVSKKYQKAFQYLNKSDSVLKKNYQEVQILKTENQIFRGNIYTAQNKITEAKPIFDQVLKSEILTQSTFLYAYSRESAARMYFLNQNHAESTKLLSEALQQIENKNFIGLRAAIYDGLVKNYLAENNQIQYHHFRKLYNDINADLNFNKKAAINYLVNINETANKEELAASASEAWNSTLYSALLGGALLLGFAGFYFVTGRKEKDLKKQEEFFENFVKRKLPAKNMEEKIDDTETEPQPISGVKKPSMLSPEKESELLEKLQVFEDSKLYLSKQISLPLLATELETNIKYLSEIIREKKNKKFNAYINNLRIDYIISQLQSDPVYLQYKVSHLAEITGFSSHSAFTSVFKTITGISPNEFIQQLSQTEKK